jgi:hypothetical protein
MRCSGACRTGTADCRRSPFVKGIVGRRVARQGELGLYFRTPICLFPQLAEATGVPIGNLAKYLLTFSTTNRLEKVHPLQGGILRLKHPSERRPGWPRENPWLFWPRFTWETLVKHAILAGAIGRLLMWQTVITYSPGARSYMDPALTPVSDDVDDTLDLLTKTTGARAAVAHFKKIAGLTSVRV